MPTAPKPQNGSICRIDSRLNQDYLLTGDCAAGLIISARSKIQDDADVICHDADAVSDATITAKFSFGRNESDDDGLISWRQKD